MSKIPAPDPNDYPQLPDMEPVSVTITEFDGPHTDSFVYEGKTIVKERYHGVLTPTSPEYAGTRIWVSLTRSWDERAGNGTAGLRNLVNALHLSDLTQEQIEDFDPDIFEFVGRQVVVFGTVNDRGYLKVVAYKRTPPAAPVTIPVAAPVAAVEEALAV